MLLDSYMPTWQVRERHQLRVPATAGAVYAALRTTDFGAHPLVRGLLGVRVLPAALARGRSGLREARRRAAGPLDLAAFERQGFRVLAEDPPHEILIGLEGAFWRPRGDLRPVDPSTFRGPVPPGLARAAWNFRVEPRGPGECLLGTETRVRSGPGAAAALRLYWLLIRPGSGVIRRLMLRAVRNRARLRA
jgi:hypothetical protein